MTGLIRWDHRPKAGLIEPGRSCPLFWGSWLEQQRSGVGEGGGHTTAAFSFEVINNVETGPKDQD